MHTSRTTTKIITITSACLTILTTRFYLYLSAQLHPFFFGAAFPVFAVFPATVGALTAFSTGAFTTGAARTGAFVLSTGFAFTAAVFLAILLVR